MVSKKDLKAAIRSSELSELVALGDIIGDGEADATVRRRYRQICVKHAREDGDEQMLGALGVKKRKPRRIAKYTMCPDCGQQLKLLTKDKGKLYHDGICPGCEVEQKFRLSDKKPL